MAFRLFKRNQQAFGLDVSEGSIKYFSFDAQGQRISVKAYNETVLPKGVMNGDTIADKQTFVHLLKQSLEKPLYGRLSTKYVVSNLPETKSFVRVIQIPKMSDMEAESAVPFEAESFIPMPIDQVYLDWQKLGDVGDKMNILIIATPKDFVDGYIEALEKAGLTPVALEVESQSCQRALIEANSKDTSLIVDMSDYRSSLIMIEVGSLQFTSTIPIAGNTFTESIARNLGVSSNKAEMIKLKVGITNTAEYPNIKTALMPVLNNLVAEIKNILRFHAEHSQQPVTKMILTGGTAKLKNLIEFMAPEFSDIPGLTIELGNPWANIKNLKNPPLDAGDALHLTTAIGLAERGVTWIS